MIFHFRNMGFFLGLGTAWYGSISRPKSTWDVKYIIYNNVLHIIQHDITT